MKKSLRHFKSLYHKWIQNVKKNIFINKVV